MPPDDNGGAKVDIGRMDYIPEIREGKDFSKLTAGQFIDGIFLLHEKMPRPAFTNGIAAGDRYPTD